MPLIWASSRGHAQTVEFLLMRDDININVQEDNGMTAVAWPAYTGNVDIIRLLTQRGADFALCDKRGVILLTYAIKKHQEEAE